MKLQRKMSDTFSVEKRSAIMRAVKSRKNKSTEEELISLFKKLKVKGWRRNYSLIGKPDFVFPKSKIVVFSDGCFWHGHSCRNVNPADNREYWIKKIKRNKKRDKLVNKHLKNKGWTVFRVWECNIKNKRLPIQFLKYFIDS